MEAEQTEDDELVDFYLIIGGDLFYRLEEAPKLAADIMAAVEEAKRLAAQR